MVPEAGAQLQRPPGNTCPLLMVMSVGTQRLGFLTVNSGRQRGS